MQETDVQSLDVSLDDASKTREQLMSELRELRERIADLQAAELRRLDAERALRETEERYNEFAEKMQDDLARMEARRRRALDELRRHQAEYSRLTGKMHTGLRVIDTLVESIHDGLVVLNSQGRVTYANAMFCNMLGRREQDIIGLNTGGIVSEESMTQLRRGLQSSRGSSVQLAWRRRDGAQVNTAASIYPVSNGNSPDGRSYVILTTPLRKPRSERTRTAPRPTRVSAPGARPPVQKPPVQGIRPTMMSRPEVAPAPVRTHKPAGAPSQINETSPDRTLLDRLLPDDYTPVFDAAREAARFTRFMNDLDTRRRADACIKKTVGRLVRTLHEAVNALAVTMEWKDSYTAGHQRRVSRLACDIARTTGMDANRIEGLRIASLLHDIGKIAIPSSVLTKSEPLTHNEINMIKVHPQVGHDILAKIEFPWPVAEIIHDHQERMDGSGYPRGLQGEEISQEARILAVADVVESMASHRPYRTALGIEAALEEIRSKRGVKFDPTAVDACLKLFHEGYSLDNRDSDSGDK